MSRQMLRAEERANAKTTKHTEYLAARAAAKRDLLDRQTEREKAGAYVGRSVAAAIAPSRSRLDKRKVQKGKPFGRIIRSIDDLGREFRLHATKGWRLYRPAA